MTDMIERAALAMAEYEHGPGSEYAECIEDSIYPDLAKVAIGAMREPTEAMAEAGMALLGNGAWQAMITEALKGD